MSGPTKNLLENAQMHFYVVIHTPDGHGLRPSASIHAPTQSGTSSPQFSNPMALATSGAGTNPFLDVIPTLIRADEQI